MHGSTIHHVYRMGLIPNDHQQLLSWCGITEDTIYIIEHNEGLNLFIWLNFCSLQLSFEYVLFDVWGNEKKRENIIICRRHPHRLPSLLHSLTQEPTLDSMRLLLPLWLIPWSSLYLTDQCCVVNFKNIVMNTVTAVIKMLLTVTVQRINLWAIKKYLLWKYYGSCIFQFVQKFTICWLHFMSGIKIYNSFSCLLDLIIIFTFLMLAMQMYYSNEKYIPSEYLHYLKHSLHTDSIFGPCCNIPQKLELKMNIHLPIWSMLCTITP